MRDFSCAMLKYAWLVIRPAAGLFSMRIMIARVTFNANKRRARKFHCGQIRCFTSAPQGSGLRPDKNKFLQFNYFERQYSGRSNFDAQHREHFEKKPLSICVNFEK